MDILTHDLHGIRAAQFDDDLREAVHREGDRIRQTTAALVSLSVEQLRRWADQVGVVGSGRIAVFNSLHSGGGRSLVELTVAGQDGPDQLGRFDDADRTRFARSEEAWCALETGLCLLLGGECHPSFVIDLDTATVVTVVSDPEIAPGEVGDVFQIPTGSSTSPTFTDDMAAAADLHARCHAYGVEWPTGLA